MDYISKAIWSLRPGSEFVFKDGDYSTIEWHSIDGEAPTQAEIDAEIAKIKKAEQTEDAAKAVAKAALLDRLGITADEAALLLS